MLRLMKLKPILSKKEKSFSPMASKAALFSAPNYSLNQTANRLRGSAQQDSMIRTSAAQINDSANFKSSAQRPQSGGGFLSKAKEAIGGIFGSKSKSMKKASPPESLAMASFSNALSFKPSPLCNESKPISKADEQFMDMEFVYGVPKKFKN